MTATVLGIRVTDAQLARWRGWVMPPVQPFLLTSDEARSVRRVARSRQLTPELRDTFRLYAPRTTDSTPGAEDGHGEDAPDRDEDSARPHLVWLDRRGARLLSADTLAQQPVRHRWPGKHPDRSRERDIARTIRWVEDGSAVSRHDDVPEATWRRARVVLPDARRVAGRFPRRSGPNCFGTVMGAAGVQGAETTWMQREPFESWLSDTTIAGGNDDNPGTVLVWRGADGAVEHAAITLGDGWLLNKPDQTWSTPVAVLSVRDGINASRSPGRRLERHTIA